MCNVVGDTQHRDSTQALLEAATELSETGERWSMAQLAKRAGVSRTTLYRRFRSRAEVEEALREAGLEGAGSSSARKRCLDALGELIAQLGPARTTIESVAEAAGVGVASVYRIFGNRRELLGAFAAERSPQSLLEAVIVDEHAPLACTLEALVAAVLQQVVEQGAWIGLALSADPESRELMADFIAVEREGRARLEHLMARYVEQGELAGEPAVLAQVLLSLAAGRALFLRADGAQPGSEDAREMVRIFIHGAGAPAS